MRSTLLFWHPAVSPVWSVPDWRHILQLKSVQVVDFNFPSTHGKALQVRFVTCNLDLSILQERLLTLFSSSSPSLSLLSWPLFPRSLAKVIVQLVVGVRLERKLKHWDHYVYA